MTIDTIREYVDRIVAGTPLNGEEARFLTEIPAGEEMALFWGSDYLRRRFRGNTAETCAIMNAKSGACSEDCIYCAQSAHFNTDASVYPMPDPDEMIRAARAAMEQGAKRFSYVTSGRALAGAEIDTLCEVIRRLPGEGVTIPICLSLGLLESGDFRKLREAGAVRYHHNLETSENHFPKVTTTHSYADRVETVRRAQEAGFEVCSGVLLGLGESRQDRIDLALAVRELKVESVPINFLTPIPGTPAAALPPLPAMEALRSVALFRYMNPEKEIRICGGREHCLGELQPLLFHAGADGIMIGNYLVVEGRSPKEDLQMIQELGMMLQGK